MLNPIILGDLSDVDVSEHENKAIQGGFIHLKVYAYLHKFVYKLKVDKLNFFVRHNSVL